MYEIGVYIQIAIIVASLAIFIISKIVRENTKLAVGLNPLQMYTLTFHLTIRRWFLGK